jgi:DNA (cytosine-5)-methyltransferase 1
MISEKLFDTSPERRTKRPKLGRYDRLKRESFLDRSDPLKLFGDCTTVKVEEGITFVDLFCGAGGITQGLVEAGLTPVASVEINEIASATHRRNFPHCRHFERDIAEVQGSDLAENQIIDIVAGGPPCQGFSVAGKRDPNDPRNRLFLEFVRIVSELRPKYVIMENVPGILTMKGGEVAEAVKEELRTLGYQVSVAVLEAADYGIPQIRARAVFMANRIGALNIFPSPTHLVENYVPIESAISDLPAWTTIPEFNHEWTRHSKAFTERISKVGPGESLYETFADAYKRQYPGLPSMTVKENHGGTHIHPFLDRVISAREMARLQTFPDDFIFCGSMKKAMWQIGNAVPPRLAYFLGRAVGAQITNPVFPSADTILDSPEQHQLF